MKQVFKHFLTITALLFVALGAAAQGNANVIKKIEGVDVGNQASPGDVSYSDGTITVTPSSGYYLTAEDITIYKTINGQYAQVRTREPSYDTPIAITATDPNADPSMTTQYNFTVPGAEYDYEITADFHVRRSVEDATVTVLGGPFTYTGTAIEPEVKVEVEGKALTAGKDYIVEYANNINVPATANNPQPTITITGQRTYINTKATTFAIAKADPTLTFSPTTATIIFGKEAEFVKPTLTTTPEGLAVTYASSNTNVATIVAASGDITPVAASTEAITITASFAGNDNYKAKDATYALTVTKGTAVVTKAPTVKENLTYTGEAQQLIVAGMSNTGSMLYKLGADGTYSADIPTGTEAKEYAVYYKAAGNGNYNESAEGGPVLVTIGKKGGTISYNTVSVNKTFGDAAFINPLTKTGDGTVSYATSNKAVATVDAASGKVKITGAGSTTITATVTDGANYTYATKTASYTVTVGAASMNVTANGYTGTYDEAAHGITVNAPADATVKYGTKAGKYNLDASPTYTNAGTYTVYYQVTKANYNAVTGSKKVTIRKAAGSISYAKTTVSKTIGDADFANSLTKTGDGVVTYSSSNTAIATVDATSGEVTLKGIGSATITATVADGTNYTYATKTVSYTLNVASNAKKFNLWINKIQVTEDNMNNILGGTRKSLQYFPDLNKLFITNNTTPVRIECKSGLTIYLAPKSNNKVKEIVCNNATSEQAPLVITTDGNFPGRLELATSGDNVIEGFDALILEENLSILEADDEVQYSNGKLATTAATIGIVIDPIVEEQVEDFGDPNFGKNPDGTENDLENYVYDDRVLLTLKNTQEDGGDGIDDSGTKCIVINNQTYEDDIDKMTLEDYTPGTPAFAEIFTGITVLVPGGEGWIVIDGETHDGFLIKLRSLFSNELKGQMTSEIRSKLAFYYTFSKPTFVGIYNGGKANSSAREKVIRPGKKKVSHIKVFNVNVSPKKVQAANPAGAASGGDYTGVVPTIGQDENNPTEIESGIKDIERSTLNVEHSADKWYNLNGQQINEPTKAGLYIYNGKKVFVKE